MTAPTAIVTIPDAAAQKARCPVCNAAPLQILRAAPQPDRLSCSRCGTAFEVERGGQRLHMVAVPLRLQSTLFDQWVGFGEIQAAIKQATVIAADPPSPSQPAPAVVEAPAAFTSPFLDEDAPNPNPQPVTQPPAPKRKRPAYLPDEEPMTDEAVVQRAKELRQLGNSPERIQSILSRTPGVSPEQIKLGLASVQKGDKKLSARRNRRLFFMLLGVVLFAICGIGSALILRQMFTGQPAIAATNDLVPEFLNPARITPPVNAGQIMATPYVVPAADPGSYTRRCPTSPQEAAALFNGPAENWAYDEPLNGWTFKVSDPVSVHIPTGMTGRYFVFVPPLGELRAANGPVNVYPVTMIWIHCP